LVNFYNYSSAQICLPDKLADNIFNWGYEHIPDKDINFGDFSFGRENEIHTTILNGIHTDDPRQVKALLVNSKPFICKLGQISLFKNNLNFDVVTIEVRSPELHCLNKDLSKLPHSNNFLEYKPHVTIAYVNPNKADHLTGNQNFTGHEFEVKEIVFSSRNGQKIFLNF